MTIEKHTLYTFEGIATAVMQLQGRIDDLEAQLAKAKAAAKPKPAAKRKAPRKPAPEKEAK